MGFDDSEAKENIESSQYELDEEGLFAPREKPAPTFRHTISASPDFEWSLLDYSSMLADGEFAIREKLDGI